MIYRQKYDRTRREKMGKKKVVGEDGHTYEVKVKKPFYKKIWFWAIVVVVVLVAFGSLGSKDEKETVTKETTEIKDNSANGETAETVVEEKKEVTEKKDEKVPTEYKTALKKAEMYSKTMYMSKVAIYDQLTSEYGEKYSPEAAQYAIDNMKADWNANALKKAESYQKDMAMSPEAIREQLSSEHGEKFTTEEADYAVNNLK